MQREIYNPKKVKVYVMLPLFLELARINIALNLYATMILRGMKKAQYSYPYLRRRCAFLSYVSKPAPLIFTVTDGDDSLGTVSLPLAQIPSVAHRRRWMPLTAKNAQANGDLCVDCWVLSFKKATSTNDGVKWNNLLTFGLKTGSKERSKRRASVEAASISMKGSRSIENLYTSSTLEPPVAEEDSRPLKSGSFSKLSPESSPTTSPTRLGTFALFKPRLAPTLGQVLSSSNAPEITGISPKSGPSSGGTRITVRGCNLGKSKEDIIYIGVSGCDLLQTLEYHSPAKLVVVSKPWIGSGPVVLETKSGGRGISTLAYTFQDRPLDKAIAILDKKGKVSRGELLSEITTLKEEIVDLTEENRSLKKYIDNLMIVLMEKFPEVLENLASSQ
ncbi:uncharacterized protein [Acropora muricata]|uniref:uncharacterized protein isoform X1 n=1 Tax=Acropora muricata TaxID=159855 RepID=UPI0034E401A6